MDEQTNPMSCFSINCFYTDEVAGLDSTDSVDEYATDCSVMVIKNKLESLDVAI